MKPFRKLRAVENCPQPEPPPYKPMVYGMAPWSRLPPTPPANEITERVRAQSRLSRGGKRAELPDIETARRINARPDKPSGRVTVPEPKSMPAAAEKHDSPSRVVAAGSNPPAIDDEAGWDEYVRRAMTGEFQPF
jgi:hypothetical protein